MTPLVSLKATDGKPCPVCGGGSNIRERIHLGDHAKALVAVALGVGNSGRTYCTGAQQERLHLRVVKTICAILDRLPPDPAGPRERLNTPVKDRLGHDFRYAMDLTFANVGLGWKATYDFEVELKKTLRWYRDHGSWWGPIHARHYGGEHLGSA